MDSVLLLKCIGYFLDYLLALSRTLSKQLYIHAFARFLTRACAMNEL